MWLIVIVLIGFSTCEYILGDKSKQSFNEIVEIRIFSSVDCFLFLLSSVDGVYDPGA